MLEKDFKRKNCEGNNAVYEDFLYRIQFYIADLLRAKGFIVKDSFSKTILRPVKPLRPFRIEPYLDVGPPNILPPPRLEWPENKLAEAMSFLEEWGLHYVLSEDDDPVLWATVVQEHWGPRANSRVGGHLEFGKITGEIGYHGHYIWRLDLRSRPFPRSGLWKGSEVQDVIETKNKVNERNPYPIEYLSILSPSVGIDKALVHSGRMNGVLYGGGTITIWRKQGMRWFDTYESVGGWES